MGRGGRRINDMLRTSAIALLATALIAVAGCGAKKNDLAPAACLASSNQYLQALEAAPSQVVLGEDQESDGQGQTLISNCLVPEQEAGQLANIGREMIVAASKLNLQARNGSEPATVQLGYLIGAVSKGADAIHTDLVRRLNSAAQFSQTGGTLPASFQRAFGRGYAAGHSSG
jgi:hypothetical protein